MPEYLPTKFPSFSEFKRYPTTALLILVCVALGYVFNSFTGTTAKNSEDKDRQIIYLQTQLSRKDSQLQDLQNKLIFKDAILNQLPSTADSMVRTPTEDKVQNLLKKK